MSAPSLKWTETGEQKSAAEMSAALFSCFPALIFFFGTVNKVVIAETPELQFLIFSILMYAFIVTDPAAFLFVMGVRVYSQKSQYYF